MQKVAAFFFGVAVFVGSITAEEELVLPDRYKEAEDDGYSGVLNTRIHVQEIYSAQHFESGPIWIWALGLRPNEGMFEEPLGSTELVISMSTTGVEPGEMDVTFKSNLGVSRETVFSGLFSPTKNGSEATQNPFFLVQFQTPFRYDNRQGNLLVDITNFGGSIGFYVDATNDSDDGISRIFDYNVESQVAEYSDTGGDILKLIYRLPVDRQPDAQFVLPRGFEEMEAQGFSGVLASAIRLQELYDSESIPAGLHLIRGIAFRRDLIDDGFRGVIDSLTLEISITTRKSGFLEAEFNKNTGRRNVTVFDGPLQVISTNSVVDGPNLFDIIVPFDHPYFYNSLDGNLLFEIRNESGALVGNVDASNSTDDGASRVFGYDAEGELGQYIDTGADVIQVQYQDPEINITSEDVHLNRQTGLFEQTMRVRNISEFTLDGIRVYVLKEGQAELYNRNGILRGVEYVEQEQAFEPGGVVEFNLEYYDPYRQQPSDVQFEASIANAQVSEYHDFSRIEISRKFISSGSVAIEWHAIPGLLYQIEYSHDLNDWHAANSPPVRAAGTRIQWIDAGPPKTVSFPKDLGARYYRIIQVKE